ncbi:hypothetical protein [Candidatus Laterigemmans baculatus]|uniref:hypothetical protein n=1 Tax=Candidatus Laterigemmans baculatus TaxID=2770505 RepID=UPI0013DB8877|nr:hypothetical protein [Candidatus Laterigemmans baculatus]
MTESILIRGGFYCGRRFHLGGYSAVWFAEEDEIKLFDSQGQLIDALTIEEFHATLEHRRAA